MESPPSPSQHKEHEHTPPPSPVDKKPEAVKEIHHCHHEKHGPGIVRMALGLFLAFLGLSLLANTLRWTWRLSVDVWKFWPIFIILAGLSLLGRGRGFGDILSAILGVCVMLFVASLFFWGGGTTNTGPVNTRTDTG